MRLTLLIIVTTIAFFLDSCCTKKECLGFESLNEIQLFNFSPEDADSLVAETYSNSNFTNRLDSSFVKARGRDSNDKDLIIFLSNRIAKDNSYKITFLSLGKVYSITNFETSLKECNCPGDDYPVLNSYQVNGQKQNTSLLSITK